jgi:hypothetical protein
MKLCSACGRHVRESTCPFCGANATDLSRARARGSRTARILGAAAIVACGGTTEPTGDGGTSKDGGSTTDVADDFSPGPMYGAVIPDAGKDVADASDANDTDADASGAALYGAPPPPKN